MTDKAVYWYVLCVRTGAEENIVSRLKKQLNDEFFTPFVPQKTCAFRRKGQKSLFQKVCFPGYVFIESDKSTNEFTVHVFPVVYQLKDAYRFLCYGNDRVNIAMREEERTAFSKVLGKERCIDVSIGFKEGDSVKIISGAMVGCESTIRRINKNRKEAVVALNMFGSLVEVSVGLEVIELKQ